MLDGDTTFEEAFQLVLKEPQHCELDVFLLLPIEPRRGRVVETAQAPIWEKIVNPQVLIQRVGASLGVRVRVGG
jgi:hypothetical protein